MAADIRKSAPVQKSKPSTVKNDGPQVDAEDQVIGGGFNSV